MNKHRIFTSLWLLIPYAKYETLALPYPVHTTNDIIVANDIVKIKEHSSNNVAVVPSEYNYNDIPIAIFQFYLYGLGCNIINMLTHKIYFEETLGREFIVDETAYQYRQGNKGVLTAYFSPKFEVIDDQQTMERYFRSYQKPRTGEDLINSKAPLIIVRTQDYGHYIRNKIRDGFTTKGVDAYYKLANEACRHLKFNEPTIQKIQLLKDMHHIPDFTKASSVGFHVRRGDKVIGESRKFYGVEYVQKLLSITDTKNKPIENCFIASDDFEAILEVKQALIDYNIGCNVYTLTQSIQHGSNTRQTLTQTSEETFQFIAELSMLIDTTYFIGNFNSNVAILVKLLRSCPEGNDATHYYQSYGVDRNYFWIYNQY